MKTNLLKLLTIVFALCIAGLISAQTSTPENLKEVIRKYQNSPFYSNHNLDALSEINIDNLKSTTEIYEVDGLVVTEILFLEWENGAWVNQAKMVNTYDNNNFLTETITYGWDEGVWKEIMKMEYTNNASGDPTEMLWYNWNINTLVWDLMFRDTYTYNASGWRIELLSEMWMVTQWMNNSKIEYSYDGNGNLIEELQLAWGFMTNVWENSTISNYTYVNDLLTEQLMKLWDGNAWENEYNTFWTYNGGTHYTEVLQKIWNNEQWENYTHGVPTYNANWNITEHLGEEWQNGAWVNDLLQLYTYDGNGNLIEVITQDWIANAWVNQLKMIYSYTGVGIFEYSNFNNSGINLTNYPNPFVLETTIAFDISEDCHVQLEIFDLAGKKVITLFDSDFTPGNYSVIWNGNNTSGNKLETGIYLYRINADGISSVKKLTIIE